MPRRLALRRCGRREQGRRVVQWLRHEAVKKKSKTVYALRNAYNANEGGYVTQLAALRIGKCFGGYASNGVAFCIGGGLDAVLFTAVFLPCRAALEGCATIFTGGCFDLLIC